MSPNLKCRHSDTMVIEPVVSLPSPMLVMVYLGGHWDGKGPVVASLHSLPVWWKGLVVFLHLPGWGKGLVAASPSNVAEETGSALPSPSPCVVKGTASVLSSLTTLNPSSVRERLGGGSGSSSTAAKVHAYVVMKLEYCGCISTFLLKSTQVKSWPMTS